jgi:hypothetical protein
MSLLPEAPGQSPISLPTSPFIDISRISFIYDS